MGSPTKGGMQPPAPQSMQTMPNLMQRTAGPSMSKGSTTPAAPGQSGPSMSKGSMAPAPPGQSSGWSSAPVNGGGQANSQMGFGGNYAAAPAPTVPAGLGSMPGAAPGMPSAPAAAGGNFDKWGGLNGAQKWAELQLTGGGQNSTTNPLYAHALQTDFGGDQNKMNNFLRSNFDSGQQLLNKGYTSGLGTTGIGRASTPSAPTSNTPMQNPTLIGRMLSGQVMPSRANAY